MGAFALLVLSAPAAWAQVRVEATVNAQTIGIEDVLELTVSVSGGSGDPRLPEMDGFRVMGRSSSSQVSIVNGRMSSTNAYIFQLLPEQEGRLTVGAVEVEVGGEVHRTRPIEIDVVPGSVAPRRQRNISPFGSGSPFGRGSSRSPEIGEEDVFLRAEASKSSIFEGEAVTITYRLFTRYVPLGPQIEDDPPLTGFWVEEVELPADGRAERTVVDGREFLVFTLKQRVLFPTKNGPLVVPALTLSTAFRTTSNDPFGSFFSRGSRPVTIRSQAATIDVAPLPTEGRSRDYSGAVGSYELKAVLSQAEVAVGDPVTLTLSIEGSGNLRAVEGPVLPEMPDFRTFDPKADERLRASAGGLSGAKRWEYVLVPESGGAKELGPWSVPYFDPGTGQYRTASAGPLKLDVSGTAAVTSGGVPITGSRGEVTVLREDIRFLKDAPSSLGERTKPYYGSTLFYLTLVLPVLWNAGFVVVQRRRAHEKQHSSRFRSRRAHRVAKRRLEKGRKLAGDASMEFYEELASALYRYVGDKKSVSPSGLTTASIDGLLEEAGAADDVRREFLAVLATCEEARFTPAARTSAEMESLLHAAEELIVKLERELR